MTKNLIKIVLFLAVFQFILSCTNENSVNEITIESFSPDKACIRDTITIKGTNFTNNIKVSITTINTEITERDSNTLKVIVPQGVSKGMNTINITNNNQEIVVGDIDIIVDDYFYLTFENQSHKLYTIGNNTAKVALFDEINITQQLSAYGFTQKDNILFLIEFDTSNLNNTLIKYNTETKSSEKINLILPVGINGAITGLNINPNNGKLLAILTEDANTTNTATHHILEIDNSTGSVNNMNLSFQHSFISSHLIKDNNLFIFSKTPPYNLSKINLTDYSYESIFSNDINYAISKPRLNENNEIIALQIKSDAVGNFIKFDDSFNITNLSSTNYYYQSFLGNGFFDKNSSKHIELFKDSSIENSSGNQPIHNSFYTFSNFNQEEKMFFRPKKTSFSLTTIIDIIE